MFSALHSTTIFGEGLGSLPSLRVLAFVCTVAGATLLVRPASPEPVPGRVRILTD